MYQTILYTFIKQVLKQKYIFSIFSEFYLHISYARKQFTTPKCCNKPKYFGGQEFPSSEVNIKYICGNCVCIESKIKHQNNSLDNNIAIHTTGNTYPVLLHITTDQHQSHIANQGQNLPREIWKIKKQYAEKMCQTQTNFQFDLQTSNLAYRLNYHNFRERKNVSKHE